MKYLLSVLAIVFGFFTLSIWNTFAAIDLNVTPIKYEINTQTWATITRPATLVNRGDEWFTIYTWKSDFVANGTDWTPRFVRYSELVYQDQQLSTWIDIDTDTFYIGPWESKTVNFTITIPNDATPGWHYWAVFFKNNASENSTWWNVGINVDYGIIILVNVDGEVSTTGVVREPRIIYPNGIFFSDNGWWTPRTPANSWEEEPPYERYPIDDCPFGDLSPSNIDGTCISTRNLFIPFSWEEPENQVTGEQNEPEENFEVIFEIPFENTWNTHIKPGGSVTLVDEDGNTLKEIWREVVINENGAVVGENIVDYIPVNDNGGNVLPNTTRIFSGEWKWFPYKEYDDRWEQIIKYWTPGEYYTKQNIEKKQFLQFWERVCEKRDFKKITALINFSYFNQDWEEVEFNSAKEFEIAYVEEYIGVNPFVVIPLIFLLLLFIFLLWFFLIAKKERRCKKCDTKVRKNWKICPNCNKKLKHNIYKGNKKKRKKTSK